MDTKKNIVILTNGSLPIPSILGGAVENLITTLLKKNERLNNYNFIVFTPLFNKTNQKNIIIDHCRFYYINTSNIFYKIARLFRYLINSILNINIENQYLYTVKNRLKEIKNIDIILIENSPSYLNYFNKSNYKIILHLHNDYITNSYIQNNKIFKNADLILTVSNYLKYKLKKYSTIHLNVETLYNGIDLNKFNVQNVSINTILNIKKRYNIKKNDYIIAFAGRVQEDKGVDVVIEAFLKHKYFKDSKLLIIGSSEFANSSNHNFKNSIKEKIKNCNDKILFTNYIDYSIIHQYFSIPNIFVLPSLCEEAFGMTILEAMASSKPLIVTDAGGITEIVNDSCSFIFKRDSTLRLNIINALEILYENSTLRNSMSISSRENSLKFSEDIYYEKFRKLIDLC